MQAIAHDKEIANVKAKMEEINKRNQDLERLPDKIKELNSQIYEKENMSMSYKTDIHKKDNDYGQLTLQCKSLAQQIIDLKDEISLREDKIKEGNKK